MALHGGAVRMDGDGVARWPTCAVANVRDDGLGVVRRGQSAWARMGTVCAQAGRPRGRVLHGGSVHVAPCLTCVAFPPLIRRSVAAFSSEATRSEAGSWGLGWQRHKSPEDQSPDTREQTTTQGGTRKAGRAGRWVTEASVRRGAEEARTRRSSSADSAPGAAIDEGGCRDAAPSTTASASSPRCSRPPRPSRAVRLPRPPLDVHALPALSRPPRAIRARRRLPRPPRAVPTHHAPSPPITRRPHPSCARRRLPRPPRAVPAHHALSALVAAIRALPALPPPITRYLRSSPPSPRCPRPHRAVPTHLALSTLVDTFCALPALSAFAAAFHALRAMSAPS
ncbi:hypothetical protein PLICRDRAFT_174455 [Plicaturopsis crispa FD-325 SS-3]|nr:hypothetical protein PLICRDRAFT_174455 [Plicaturopsis crispa FD-325 SS-3]